IVTFVVVALSMTVLVPGAYAQVNVITQTLKGPYAWAGWQTNVDDCTFHAIQVFVFSNTIVGSPTFTGTTGPTTYQAGLVLDWTGNFCTGAYTTIEGFFSSS